MQYDSNQIDITSLACSSGEMIEFPVCFFRRMYAPKYEGYDGRQNKVTQWYNVYIFNEAFCVRRPACSRSMIMKQAHWPAGDFNAPSIMITEGRGKNMIKSAPALSKLFAAVNIAL